LLSPQPLYVCQEVFNEPLHISESIRLFESFPYMAMVILVPFVVIADKALSARAPIVQTILQT
jgi:hypothetical protein